MTGTPFSSIWVHIFKGRTFCKPAPPGRYARKYYYIFQCDVWNTFISCLRGRRVAPATHREWWNIIFCVVQLPIRDLKMYHHVMYRVSWNFFDNHLSPRFLLFFLYNFHTGAQFEINCKYFLTVVELWVLPILSYVPI